jgi:hypothetical protein
MRMRQEFMLPLWMALPYQQYGDGRRGASNDVGNRAGVLQHFYAPSPSQRGRLTRAATPALGRHEVHASVLVILYNDSRHRLNAASD